MALAINLVALLLVLGMCWAATMWYTRHSKRHADLFEAEFHRNRVAAGSASVAPGEPCAACEGLGAQTVRGSITPCPSCMGTGEQV